MRVSLTMIVRNEENNLPDSLGGVAGLVDEIVVVDTGSTDRTREVARRWGARVVDFAWIDDFAAARNEALRHATGDWILWLDADDRLDALNRERLRAVLAQLPDANWGVGMRCVSLPPPGRPGRASCTWQTRLFRNHPHIRWQYRAHEQIEPAIQRTGGTFVQTDVVIHHLGYQQDELHRQKRLRNWRLLRLEAAERPDDPFVLYYLGRTCVALEEYSEAVPPLERCLRLSSPQLPHVASAFAQLTQALTRLDRKAAALAVCLAGRRHFPADADLLSQEAVLRLALGDYAGAETCFRELARQPPEEVEGVLIDRGMPGWQARHNLAVALRCQRRWAEAEAVWRALLHERGDYTEAWLGLADLCLIQGKLAEAERILHETPIPPALAPEALVVAARLRLVQGRLEEARQLVGQAIALDPRAVPPRVVLSHVLLREDRDAKAIEQALRDVLALQPDHAEAGHNLAVLYRRLGRWTEAEAIWRTVIERQPAYTASWMDLGDLLRQLGRRADWLALIERAEGDPNRRVEAAVLRANWLRHHGEFTAARQLLEEAIAHNPQAVVPRIALAHVLLDEGRDWDAAAAVLHSVLELLPGHADSQRLLEFVRRRQRPALAGGSPSLPPRVSFQGGGP
ncbi:MAG: tetratricopeptide repeat protein [Gemmataceae bacterium]|nr:tetratricopeptide repeat protein [Gemmataceae bacterium]MDW8265429.1 tetratricopeptide repeat protein [Gemmataceae bacterium]